MSQENIVHLLAGAIGGAQRHGRAVTVESVYSMARASCAPLIRAEWEKPPETRTLRLTDFAPGSGRVPEPSERIG
jgi:hypothetical protein